MIISLQTNNFKLQKYLFLPSVHSRRSYSHRLPKLTSECESLLRYRNYEDLFGNFSERYLEVQNSNKIRHNFLPCLTFVSMCYLLCIPEVFGRFRAILASFSCAVVRSLHNSPTFGEVCRNMEKITHGDKVRNSAVLYYYFGLLNGYR